MQNCVVTWVKTKKEANVPQILFNLWLRTTQWGPCHQERNVFCTGASSQNKLSCLLLNCFSFMMVSKWAAFLWWVRGRLLKKRFIFLLPQIFFWTLRVKFRNVDKPDVLIKLKAYLCCLPKHPQKFPIAQCSDFFVLPVRVPAGIVSSHLLSRLAAPAWEC